MFFANNGLHITKNAKDFTKLADSYNRCTAVGLWPGTVDTVSAMTNEYGVLYMQIESIKPKKLLKIH